jgi:DNA modification methylase
MSKIELFKGDCLEVMKGIPDEKYFEIAQERIWKA